ncbi:unnamed protein product [Polarella glacialis]|uniref:Uncharacterized protein n=1 Tax=Polarella glacialis TaxID=89957 RepID=A0A813LR55_POLGL|nr:unnamed protein product [Polarella glacialis]
MEEGAGSKDAVQRSALADASTAVLFSASGSFASEVVAVERLASLPRPDEGQLVAGANVYVRSHGPARLVSAPSPAGFCQVEYPDSSTDEVPKEAILFTQERLFLNQHLQFSARTAQVIDRKGAGLDKKGPIWRMGEMKGALPGGLDKKGPVLDKKDPVWRMGCMKFALPGVGLK